MFLYRLVRLPLFSLRSIQITPFCDQHLLDNRVSCFFKNHTCFSSAAIPGLGATAPHLVGEKNCGYSSGVQKKQQETDEVLRRSSIRERVRHGPDLWHFTANVPYAEKHGSDIQLHVDTNHPFVRQEDVAGEKRKVYFDVYGCQMNVNDTEIVWAILQKHGFLRTRVLKEADVILVVTCSIREGAEQKIWSRLQYLRTLKKLRAKNKSTVDLKIGVLGCMAERLKQRLIEQEKSVDLVAGPDSYRDLPQMLALTESNQMAVNVLLSLDETYADIVPVRLNKDSVTAFVSIMRGCDNMCNYCIVPFTRGRERSRPVGSILDEVRCLSDQGVKEVTLLGQNVNSYRDMSEVEYRSGEKTQLAAGFTTVYKPKKGGLWFVDLLDKVSRTDPNMRIRFTSPHPKDFPDEVLYLISERPNICSALHLPAQSGNSRVLEAMRRGYTREAYTELVHHVRNIIPDVSLSSDFICGFCGETEEEFGDTLSLLRLAKYSVAYLFAYSMREKTRAYRQLADDVPQEVKMRRLAEMVQVFREEAEKVNQALIGSQQLVLVEGRSKRSDLNWAGRNDGNTKVIFPVAEIPASSTSSDCRPVCPGDYIVVQINGATSQVLRGTPVCHTTLQDFHSEQSRHVWAAP